MSELQEDEKLPSNSQNITPNPVPISSQSSATRPSDTGTSIPEEITSTSQGPQEVTSAWQTSVSELATNDEYIDFHKMPKSKEAFVALLRIFCKNVDRAASEKKAKALHKQLGLNQLNVFQTNHHWVYLCQEETTNDRWG